MTVPARTLQELQGVGRDLYTLALVSSHGGNLSVKDGHGLWITGTGTRLGHLAADDVSYVQANGHHEGPMPSRDTILHTAVYAVTGAGAVAHGHPRHAIALSLETDLFVPADYEGSLHLTDVPVIERGPLQEQQIAAALQSRLVVLLRGHGAYARGQDLWEALHWVTALEESAQIEVIGRSMRDA